MSRLLIYTIPAVLLLGYFIYQAFFMVLTDSVSKLARNFAEQKVLYYNDKTSKIILRERNIVQYLAASPELIAWAMNENNAILKKQGIDLLEKHRPALRDHSYFIVIDKSKHYYFNDKDNTYAGKQLRYTLSPDISRDRWYYTSKKINRQCQINVNRDRKLDVTKVWINCLMHHGKDIVGIMGTGIDLTDFIHAAVQSNQPGVHNLYINQQGMIQAATEIKMIDFSSLTHHGTDISKSILNLFDRQQDRAAFSRFLEQANHSHQYMKTIMANIHGRPYVVSMEGIKAIGWINVTMVDLNKQHIEKYFLPFALLMGLAMALILILMIFLLNRLILKRIHRLDKNIRKVEAGDYSIHRDDAASDEIGRLTGSFFNMATAIRDYTTSLEKKVGERTADLENSRQEAEADREQLDAIISQAMDGIIHINTQGIIQSFNPASEKIFGYAKSEVLRQNVKMLMPEPNHSQHDAYLKRYLNSGEDHALGREREVTALRKNGETFPMALSANIMHLKEETYFIGIVRDITDRRQAEEKIRKLALFDGLTGLPNRGMFMDRMQQALALAHRNKSGFFLFFLDLDNFKTVNDMLGHAAGDHVLKLVADRLCTCVREVDTVARLGGDEFTLVLPGMTKRKQAITVADKIIASSGEPMLIHGKEYQYHIGASIGIAMYPDDGNDLDTLIHCADEAMYAAKKLGNHYLFYGDAKPSGR